MSLICPKTVVCVMYYSKMEIVHKLCLTFSLMENELTNH